jgi:RNA polymerase sigma factor (sigma-70 family)
VPALQEDWISSLVDESGRELLRFLARRLGNETEAEDLAQEVYLRLLRVDDVSHVRNRRAYVLRVAANVAHEWRMLARNRRVHSSENIEEQVSTSHGPQELATQEQDMRCLMRALSTLSPVCRSVVLLLKRDGLSLEQVAAHVGYSVPMVRKHLALGLMVCQEALSRAHGEGAQE